MQKYGFVVVSAYIWIVGSSKTLVIRSRYGYPVVFALCFEPTFGFSFLVGFLVSFVDCT